MKGLAWLIYALALLAAPWLLAGSFEQTLASQIGIAIISCLAYNLLLGQGGMLSFGHAIYSGAGAYLAIAALRQLNAGAWPELLGWLPPVLWVASLPLVGALAGAALAALLGALCARHGGTAFGMITLGLGELVAALALMWPQVFGGDGGLSANRVAGPALAGINFGPQWQVLALVALYTLGSTWALYALTRTPLGLLLGAVRDNPERLAFLGHSPAWVRWLGLVISGAFSGLAGGLAALHFELVSVEVFGSQRSAALLLFVFVGGSAHFAGPILGALLMVLCLSWLATFSPAWPLYLGLVFLGMVMFAPTGLAGLLAGAWHALRRWRAAGAPLRPALRWLGQSVVLLLAAALLVVAVEWLYQRQLGTEPPPLGSFHTRQVRA